MFPPSSAYTFITLPSIEHFIHSSFSASPLPPSISVNCSTSNCFSSLAFPAVNCLLLLLLLPQVIYRLEADTKSDVEKFTISTVDGEGVLRLVGDLDYERKSLYQLRVSRSYVLCICCVSYLSVFPSIAIRISFLSIRDYMKFLLVQFSLFQYAWVFKGLLSS